MNTQEPILETAYWQQRIAEAPPDQLWKAVYNCTEDHWLTVERNHQGILAFAIGPEESILDLGCGWGRLLNMLPDDWCGQYLGVDLSPDFLEMARKRYPHRTFLQADIRYVAGCPLVAANAPWDWAVMISMEAMFKLHVGMETWAPIEKTIRQVAKKLLYLEYTRGYKVLAEETPPGHKSLI